MRRHVDRLPLSALPRWVRVDGAYGPFSMDRHWRLWRFYWRLVWEPGLELDERA